MAKHILEHAGHDHGDEPHSHTMEDMEPYLYMIGGIIGFYVLDVIISTKMN